MIFNGEIWLPVMFRYSMSFVNVARPAVWHGLTGSASPSFSMDDHCPEQGDVWGWNGCHKLLVDGGTLYSMWEPSNTSGFNTKLIDYRKNTGSGWDVLRTNLIDFAVSGSPFATPYSNAESFAEESAAPFAPIAAVNDHGFSLPRERPSVRRGKHFLQRGVLPVAVRRVLLRGLSLLAGYPTDLGQVARPAHSTAFAANQHQK